METENCQKHNRLYVGLSVIWTVLKNIYFFIKNVPILTWSGVLWKINIISNNIPPILVDPFRDGVYFHNSTKINKHDPICNDLFSSTRIFVLLKYAFRTVYTRFTHAFYIFIICHCTSTLQTCLKCTVITLRIRAAAV